MNSQAIGSGLFYLQTVFFNSAAVHTFNFSTSRYIKNVWSYATRLGIANWNGKRWKFEKFSLRENLGKFLLLKTTSSLLQSLNWGRRKKHRAQSNSLIADQIDFHLFCTFCFIFFIYWHSMKLPPPTLEALLFCLFREEGILFPSSMISLKLSSFFSFSFPKLFIQKFEVEN